MKPGEYNPPHIHSNCDLSSVLFISIPEKLKKKIKNGMTQNQEDQVLYLLTRPSLVIFITLV